MLERVAVDGGCHSLEVVVQTLCVGQRIAVENVNSQSVQTVGRDLAQGAAIVETAAGIRGGTRQPQRRVADVGERRAGVIRALREVSLPLEQRWHAEFIDRTAGRTR